MTGNLLWSPKEADNPLKRFIKLNQNKNRKLKNYKNLHKWSITNKKEFWKAIWKFTNIKGILKNPIIKNEKNFIKSEFFKNCKLNFAENLIQKNNNEKAIVFYSEKGTKRIITWKKLEEQTSKFSNYLLKNKIKKGDRVAAVLPNIPETVICFLSTAKIGSIWSSCSSDFGSKAIIDRFKQIEPKILIVSDYYYYNNKKINTLKNIKEISNAIPSIKKIVIIPYNNKKNISKTDFIYDKWNDIIKSNNKFTKYRKFNFNTPLYILYSSGTTGEPKCIVHSAGGALIQHKKEHQLHCNIEPNDKVFYFTTCGWMMWNWLVSCLATNATIYLYDGSPLFPNNEILLKILEEEKINFFGVSAKYLDTLKNNKVNVINKYKLKSLKTISSTGSPLVHETFEYVYKNIKKNVHLASISGGTDLVSCFVLGNPNMPVYSGEIQCKGLGMDVLIYNEKGKKLNQRKGELVCKSSFPSKPLFFWKDKNNTKFIKTYFNKFKNIWYHGDFASKTKNDGFIIYGRSDATLNSGGIRIGTAELYRVVENFNNVSECVAVEQKYKNDTRVILFIKLQDKKNLNLNIIKNIKYEIKTSLSPKHVPKYIIKVNDIPKTKSGKIVELAIKNLINNEKITNLSSLSNPECINEFREKIKKLT